MDLAALAAELSSFQRSVWERCVQEARVI